MKRHAINSSLMLFIALLVTNCAPQVPQTVVSTPSQIVTLPSIATEEPPTEIVLVPTAGPSMEVGSTYAYVDGGILVAVPAGEFIMGGDGPENPAHRVTLRDFWIYSTKVTNQQYKFCEDLGQCTTPDQTNNPAYRDRIRANDPVVGVTYHQAAAYCSFVRGRLPTEAEWEKSARGPDGNRYPWGNSEPNCDLLNFNNCVGGITSVVSYPKGASVYGALEMAGNVLEWVQDWYDPNYYSISPAENPLGPESGTMRTVRSSTHLSTADQAALTNRYPNTPENQRTDLGFRCVVEDPTYFAPFCESALLYRSNVSDAPQASEACPALNIDQAPYCVQTSPVTDITFSGPPDATIDSGSCAPTGDPNRFTCSQPGAIVSIRANCQENLPGNPSCPSGFSQQNNACVADGGGGQCLTGWNYDSSRQCCISGGGPNSISITSICPVGTFFAVNQNACLPYPVQGIVDVSYQVRFNSCSLPTTPPLVTITPPGGGSCQPQECSISHTWDPNLCCCTVNGTSCS
jgi:formylglycine-generating enzyme required for sulfatase activity